MRQHDTRRLLPLALLLAGACAPPPQAPSPVLEARLDSIAAVEEVIRGHGELPDQEAMRPDVRLIGPPARVVDGRIVEGDAWYTGAGPIVRDTVTGDARVADWLRARRALQGSGTPFGLRSGDVYLCEDAALQYGTYLSPPLGRGNTRPLTHRFAARWVEADPDDWRLELLWLQPPSGDARPGRLGAGCRSAAAVRSSAAYLGRRLGLQVLAGLTRTTTVHQLSSAFRDRSWETSLQEQRSILSASFEGFHRIGRRWEVAALASYHPTAYVSAVTPGDDWIMRLERSGVTAGMLAVYQSGPLRFGAGPALVLNRWTWDGDPYDLRMDPPDLPVQEEWTTAAGAVAQTAFVQPLASRVYAHVTARYAYFPSVDVPGYYGIPPFEVTVSGPTLGLGLGWWW